MSIRARNKRRGFTLLEVMIATMIIALLTFTLYRFLVANLNAIRVSTELSDEREALQAIARVLQSELNDLPPRGKGSLAGKANVYNNLACDELTWICGPGQGLMTAAGAGEYKVTLTVQPVEKSSAEQELGLRRVPVESGEQLDADWFNRGSGTSKYNWLPLIRPMAAIEVRYFDPRLNGWLERWNDPTVRPSLVRVRLWKRAEDEPLETVLSVPSANVQL